MKRQPMAHLQPHIPHAHQPERLSRKRLIAESILFVLGIVAVIAAMSLDAPV